MPSGSALVLLPMLWVTVFVGMAPLLLSGRIRSSLGAWPTDWLSVNYLLAVLAVATVHVGVFLVGGVQFGPGDLGLLWYALGVNAGIPALGWLLVAVALPWYRDESIPHETALPLALGAVWYVFVTTVLLGVLAFVLFVLYFPG